MTSAPGRPTSIGACVAALACAAALTACQPGASPASGGQGAAGGPSAVVAPSSRATPAPATWTPTGTLPAGDRYAATVAVFHRLGLQVWIETDLVKRWLQGPAAFRTAMDRVAALARLPGVAGVKVADELGYQDGIADPAAGRRFLHDVSSGLKAAAPQTKILIDMVVPELGCLPWHGSQVPQAASCAEEQRRKWPAASIAAVDSYVASGDLDVLDLSAGLRDAKQYAAWGLDEAGAMAQAWTYARQRGWDRLVTLQARKALAHPGADPDSAAATAAKVHVFVDVPLQGGARAVDVWTWRQTYQGQTVRLLDPGLKDNALWQELLRRRAAGDRLLTHFTPSQVEVGLEQDAARLAQVFTGVFVAAGTG
jgi:hypothetical protein